MKNSESIPWASGPGEILKHGLSLLKHDSDSNRRLAMICIDNAVELMMKTYLGLPYRITGIKVPRKEYLEFSESFLQLLDAIEKYASNKLDGIHLGEIEWYHRIRNELYHQGNGLTVERNNVEVYSEVANMLFYNLFGFRLVEPKEEGTELLGRFMNAWIDFEKTIVNMSFIHDEVKRVPTDAIKVLYQNKYISRDELQDIENIKKIRNEVIHGKSNHSDVINHSIIKDLIKITEKVKKRTLEE